MISPVQIILHLNEIAKQFSFRCSYTAITGAGIFENLCSCGIFHYGSGVTGTGQVISSNPV